MLFVKDLCMADQIKEPFMRMTVNGREHDATPSNTALYHHLGEAALYNHIFTFVEVEMGEGKTRKVGAYIFQRLMPDVHAFMAEYMGENMYPAHINLREASEMDVRAFEGQVHALAEGELNAGVPTDWA